MLYKEIALPFIPVLKKIPSIVFDIIFYMIVGTTFLGCVNFFSLQGTFILISLVLSIIYILLKGKIIFDIATILAFAFAISYSIPAFLFYKDQATTTLMYTLALVVYIQFFHSFENKRRFMIFMGSAFIGGLFVSFLLIVLMTYWVQGDSFDGEAVTNFWTGTVITRTGLSLYAMGAIGVVLILLFFKSKFRRWYTIPALLFIFGFVSIISLLVGNRSYIVAIAILLYAILFYKTIVEEKWVRWLITLGVLSVFLISIYTLITLNNKGVIHVPEELLQIKAIRRLFTLNPASGRPQLLQRFFSEFYKYPFGNFSKEFNNSYVHNLLLDYYSFGGVIPFLIAVAFFFLLFIRFIQFSKLDNYSLFEKSVYFGIIFALIGIGFSEPIYQANPNCVTILLLILLYMSDAWRSYKLKRNLVTNQSQFINESQISGAPIIMSEANVFETKKTSSSKSAIILITFNKPKALINSFNNLLKIDYLGHDVDLIISIDQSGSGEVEKVAKKLEWPFGNLIIRSFIQRQGLKNHILQCYEYAEKYDVIFLIEDDIYLSDSTYAYGYNAAMFYDDNEDIAGISLYNFESNWQNWALRFEPRNTGYDTYFIRLAQSWGEVVTRKQWQRFKNWLNENQEFVADDNNVPLMNKWPDSSWLKFFDRYCFLNNKFFVYPYISLSTNCNGVGDHNSNSSNDYQVNLQLKKNNYNFQPFVKGCYDTVAYDEYFNPLWIEKTVGYSEEDLTVDLWCTRDKKQFKKYVLTAGYYGEKYLKKYSLSLHPIELSIENNIDGEGIYIYEANSIIKKKPDKYYLTNYSLRVSDWRRIKFYGSKLFWKTYFRLIKKKIKKIFDNI